MYPKCFATKTPPKQLHRGMQALLDTWRAELARRPLSMSEADAAAVLGLPPPDADGGADFNEEALKAAYRAAARKYHPDKNPAGMFPRSIA